MAEQNDIVIQRADLISLAMILVYKDVSHVSLKRLEVINLLRTAAAELKNIPIFKFKFVQNSKQHNPKFPKSTATLLDLFAEHAAEYNYSHSFIAKEPDEPIRESVQEILDNLIDNENKNHVHLYKSKVLSNAIERFLRNLLKSCGVVFKDIKELIENAKKQQSAFVMPNDLRIPQQIQAALATAN